MKNKKICVNIKATIMPKSKITIKNDNILKEAKQMKYSEQEIDQIKALLVASEYINNKQKEQAKQEQQF